MTSRAHIAEDSLSAARSAASKAEGELNELRAAGDSIPAAEAQKLKQRIASLEDEKDTLAREITKAREVCDIASSQATAATALIKDRETEIADLSEQVRSLAARSDDDCIIGKLQSTVLSLKTNFHVFLRKHDALRLALQRSRIATMALEVAADQKTGEMLAVREDSRIKQLALQSVVDELQTQLRAIGRDGFTLAQAQHFNDSVRKLSAAVAASTAELHVALQQRAEAQQDAETAQLHANTLQRLCDDLKATLAAADVRIPAATTTTTAAGLYGRSAADGSNTHNNVSSSSNIHNNVSSSTSSSSNHLTGALTGLAGQSTREVVSRFSQLHDQLKTERLTSLRQRRELAAHKEAASALQKRVMLADAHVGSLEEKLVSLDAELRRREDEFRRQLYAATRNSAAPAGADMPMHELEMQALHDVTQESANSLRQANSALKRCAKDVILTLSKWKRWARTLHAQIRNSSNMLGGSSSSAAFMASALQLPEDLRRGNVGSLLSKEMRRLLDLPLSGVPGIDDDDDDDFDGDGGNDGSDNSGGGITQGRIREHYEAEIKRVQQQAQEAISSLRALLDKKNNTVVEYQEKLDKLKHELEVERQAFASEKGRISVAAYEEQRQTIERLRAALRDLQHAPAGLGSAAVNEELLARTESIERELDAKSRRVEELETAVSALQAALDAAQSRALAAGERVATLEAELLRHQQQHGLLLRKQSADAAGGSSGGSSSKDVIAELRAQLAGKDTKLRGLQASLAALKREFVLAEEEHAAAFAQLQATTTSGKNSRKATTAAAAAKEDAAGDDKADALLQSKVDTLLETVNRLKQELTELKQRETAVEHVREQLSREVDRLKAELLSQRDINAGADATERRLRAEIARLQSLNSELQKQQMRSEHEESKTATTPTAAATVAATPTTATAAHNTTAAAAGGGNVDVQALVRRIRVLEAQNAAFRSAAAAGGTAMGPTTGMPASLDTATVHSPAFGAGRGAIPPPIPTETPSMLPAIAKGKKPATAKPTVALPTVATGSDDKSGRNDAADVALLEERLRNAAEGERKAKKRIEQLLGKLNEKQKELDDTKAAEAGASSALSRLKAERDALEKRLLSMQKKQQALDAATTAALEEIEPLASLKDKLFTAEEEIRSLRAKADIELPAVISRLEAECSGALKRAETAESTVAELQQQLLHAQAGKVDGAAELHALRLKLAESRRNIAALETALMTKDVSIHELQNEADANREALDKLRKRIGEVNAYSVIAGRAKGSVEDAQSKKTATTSAPSTGPTGKTRREADLEDAVTALRRTNEKQKLEIERLRKLEKGAAVSVAPTSLDAELQDKLQDAQAEVRRLQLQLQSYEARMRTAGDAGASANVSEVIALRSQLTDAAALASELRNEVTRLQQQLSEAQASNAELQQQLTRVGSSVVSGAASVAQTATNNAITSQPPSPPRSTVSEADHIALLEQVRSLREENARLLEELSAFDVNFFEEIEDLKWKYSEASKKCQAFDEYVKMYPPR